MQERKPISHGIAGLSIAVGVIIVAIVTMGVARGSAQPGSGAITYAVIIAGLILFIWLYGAAKGNRVTFGELFSYGFKTTAVYTIIFVGFLLLYSVLFPEFKTAAIETTRTQIEDGGSLPEAQAEQSLAIMEKYFWVLAIGGTTLFFVIVGAIGSLIGAAVTKKLPPTSTDQLPA